MADKYITSSQYEKGIRKMKEYIDKSIPHIKTQELITIPADTVLEIFNSDNHMMEFDKPSNINLDYDFIVNYNNEEINCTTGEDETGKYIECFNDNTILLRFYLGVGINGNANETKMVLAIERLNTDTITDLILKQVESKKYLNNKYLKDDVAIKNSITIGTRLFGNSIGQYSFSNGAYNIASGDNSHAEGHRSKALYLFSHAEGNNTTASGESSHAEGTNSKASGESSHAEGDYTIASGNSSHAEGKNTTASAFSSHAEGVRTNASGDCSHVEGVSTTASGNSSHAEGYYTIAKGQNQHVQGKYNIEDTANKYAHIVGNGTSLSDRKNAHTLDWNGNGWYAGKLSQEGTPTEDKDLTTKKYVDANNITDAEIDAVFNELSMKTLRSYKINYDYDKSTCTLNPTPSYIYENDGVCIYVTYSDYYTLGSITVMQGKNDITNDVVSSDKTCITLKSINDDIDIKIVLNPDSPQ